MRAPRAALGTARVVADGVQPLPAAGSPRTGAARVDTRRGEWSTISLQGAARNETAVLRLRAADRRTAPPTPSTGSPYAAGLGAISLIEQFFGPEGTDEKDHGKR
ncbi:hypothetical protein ABZX85_38370 [Streptomyces sp. NPDC004539]|uniref:hypothetical protein n=1 Tax=Streptomyces sp. NPDC004539 TaxID=3154280 RepID=UPI0033A14B95